MKALLFFFLFLLCISDYSWAQTHNIKFNLVTGKNEISIGKINSITQDVQGYMWFADQTNRCITRYDGYSMVSFRNEPLNNNSLGGTYPECIFADPSGIIWIGFYGTGVDRFDPETRNFTHFRHHPNDPASLSNDTVTAILTDHLGNLWVGDDGGLELLDFKTSKFKHYSHNAKDAMSLSSNRIRALYEDRQGTLWIGTGMPFESVITNDGGLNRFNRKTETFTRYVNDPKNPATLINNKVRAIFEDSRGTFWVGTAGDGLHTMDRATGIFTRHTYNPAHPEQLSRPPVKDNIQDHITFITEDGTGAIWIGTYKAGLTRFDPMAGTLVRFNSNSPKPGGFTANSCWTAYTSRDNVLWVSTEPRNLYQMNPFHIAIPHYASAGSVTAFFQETGGALWIGTNQGVIRDDRSSKKIEQFMHSNLNPASISSSNISGISKDNKGNLWIGTYGGGLNKFDADKRTFTHYRHNSRNNNSLISDTIYKTYVDHEGLLWISTINGLDQMNFSAGTFTHYQNNSKDINSLSYNNVRDIFEDKQKRLWVSAYYGGGLNVLDLNTHNFKHYFPEFDVKCIYQDSDNTIWVGTTSLYRFDETSGTFLIFTDPQNKVGFNDVSSIIEDNEKNLWVGTSDGIVRLNGKRNKFNIYGKNHGVQIDLNARAGYKGLNNELFFGAAAGYYDFFPKQLVRNRKPPEILLSEFRLQDKIIKPGQNSPLHRPLTKTKEIILKYTQNVFSFDFAAIDYSSPEENRHLFMLQNYDNKWHPSGSEHTAYYYNIPPGHYIFKVKAANSEEVWAEKDISITITPPWWHTWWAYMFFGLGFIASIFIVDRVQRGRLIAKERERAREKELSQAREIEKAYNELKRTQAQLIQSEKMASLGELTAGIAHEIQNPLNFVNNFSEVSTELVDELKGERLKVNGERDEALEEDILNDLSQNLVKINYHGKRADAIVKGMLQHSRVSSGNKEPTDINALADECLRLSYHGLRAKDKDFNADFKTDFDKSIGKIEVVPQDIGRVLLNLYNNAFQAVAEKKKAPSLKGENYEPTVWVTTKRISLPSGAGGVEISVKDNGTGIPDKVVDKIFQPFFTTKPTGQGTGLGLSLSYDIIKAHGGEIKVETREGEGAEFIIQLPVV